MHGKAMCHVRLELILIAQATRYVALTSFDHLTTRVSDDLDFLRLPTSLNIRFSHPSHFWAFYTLIPPSTRILI